MGGRFKRLIHWWEIRIIMWILILIIYRLAEELIADGCENIGLCTVTCPKALDP